MALPDLVDPNFHRSVVLLLEHGEQGSLGIVLNRASDLALDEVSPGWATRAATPPVLFWGGPVSSGALVCLGRAGSDASVTGFRRLAGRVGTVDLDLDAADLHPSVDGIRLFSGYAGWGPDQLDEEIEEGSWLVVAGTDADAVDPDPVGLWRRVLARQGGRLAWMANFPPDVSVN